VALTFAGYAESLARITRSHAGPRVTRFGLSLMGGENLFSIDRGRRDFGFSPRFSLDHGVRLGVNWFLHKDSRINISPVVQLEQHV
jgi:hypothetical protein